MTLMAFVRYGLHLIHVMEAHWIRDKLAAVKFSVTQNFGALLITLLMLLIFVYMASLIAFAAFRDSYDQQDGMFCDTLLQCFLTTTSFGLRMGGGIGDALLVETSFDKASGNPRPWQPLDRARSRLFVCRPCWLYTDVYATMTRSPPGVDYSVLL